MIVNHSKIVIDNYRTSPLLIQTLTQEANLFGVTSMSDTGNFVFCVTLMYSLKEETKIVEFIFCD